MQKRSTWNQEYYETLEFYYWEPQHLGKIKDSMSKYNSLGSALDHIRRMEVSLNHQFNTFFSLLPDKETNKLFTSIFKRKFDEKFCFNSKDTRNFVESFKSATQPDLFFPSPTELVCMEMKVGAKSDFDQLMKYLLLSVLANEQSDTIKKFSLLYIGVGDVSTLFKERCKDLEDVRTQFLTYDIGERTKNKSINLAKYREQIYQLSQEIDIAYLSYADFHKHISMLSQSTDNEALQNIYNGITAELELRGLA